MADYGIEISAQPVHAMTEPLTVQSEIAPGLSPLVQKPPMNSGI